MPTLIVIGPNLAVCEYELERTHSIGRHVSNSIHLAEEKASRMHCTVQFARGQATVEDLNSANGVFVNGSRITKHDLKHNDRISIGATTIIYCENDSPEKLKQTKVLLTAVSSDVHAIIPDDFLPETPTKNVSPAAAAIRPNTPPVKTVRPARKSMPVGTESTVSVVVLIGLVATVAGIIIWQAQPAPPPAPAAPRLPTVAKVPAPQKEKEPERVVIADSVPPKREPVPEPSKSVDSKPETPRVTLDDQLKSALAARDRALGGGNLLGAKAALQSFLASVPVGLENDDRVRRARNELDDTTKVANAALDLSLDQARSAMIARHFHLVAQRCTNLISNDPNGPYGKKAREMLERIDELTAQAAATAKAKALDAVARGQLAQARTAVESVMGELTGTRWAGDIDTLQFQLIVTMGFLDKVEAERAKRAAIGELIPMSYAAKKIDGSLQRVNGLQAQMRVGKGQIEMPVSLKNLDTKEIISFLDPLELSDHYAELACLWSVLGRQDDARKASEAALKRPGDMPLATTLAGLLTNSKNLHLYDFKNWRQQLDWEALSGSWLSQDGKYVLESADGGETALKPASIGGEFPLETARVSFEFEIRKPSAGWFFICELGGEKQAVVLSFNATEVTLQDKSNAKIPAIKWTRDKARVDLAIDGDTVALSLDGKPAGTLSIPGIAKLKGTITFRARQCACAMDNVVLRSQE